MNFSYDMQIFYFRDGHVTTFRHPSGAYICQIPGQTLQTSKRHTFRVSTFHRYHWFGVKLFPVACAQDSRRYPKNATKAVLGSGSAHAINSGIVNDSTRPHLHCDGLPPKSRRSVDLGCVTSITEKHSRFGLAWSRPCADRGLSRHTSVFRTTTGVCKILSRSVEIWQYEGQKTCF